MLACLFLNSLLIIIIIMMIIIIIIILKDMVCLRNICINTLHKVDSIFTYNNNNNNNNNNAVVVVVAAAVAAAVVVVVVVVVTTHNAVKCVKFKDYLAKHFLHSSIHSTYPTHNVLYSVTQ
jgi:hypothetical protein